MRLRLFVVWFPHVGFAGRVLLICANSTFSSLIFFRFRSVGGFFFGAQSLRLSTALIELIVPSLPVGQPCLSLVNEGRRCTHVHEAVA